MDEVIQAVEQSPESFLYHQFAVEGEGDVERSESFMQRRLDLMARITESDKMHTAMIDYNQELSEKTRTLVRERRRAREAEHRRRDAIEARRAERPKQELADAAVQYQKQLEELYDEPKSKTRKRKTTAKKVEEPVEIDGRTDEEVIRDSQE